MYQEPQEMVWPARNTGTVVIVTTRFYLLMGCLIALATRGAVLGKTADSSLGDCQQVTLGLGIITVTSSKEVPQALLNLEP